MRAIICMLSFVIFELLGMALFYLIMRLLVLLGVKDSVFFLFGFPLVFAAAFIGSLLVAKRLRRNHTMSGAVGSRRH